MNKIITVFYCFGLITLFMILSALLIRITFQFLYKFFMKKLTTRNRD